MHTLTRVLRYVFTVSCFQGMMSTNGFLHCVSNAELDCVCLCELHSFTLGRTWSDKQVFKGLCIPLKSTCSVPFSATVWDGHHSC